jgi:hypothetical protein
LKLPDNSTVAKLHDKSHEALEKWSKEWSSVCQWSENDRLLSILNPTEECTLLGKETCALIFNRSKRKIDELLVGLNWCEKGTFFSTSYGVHYGVFGIPSPHGVKRYCELYATAWGVQMIEGALKARDEIERGGNA